MNKTISIINILVLSAVLSACSQTAKTGIDKNGGLINNTKEVYPNSKSDEEWKKILSPLAFEVMVKESTEPPFKNPYHNHHIKGIYVSAATGNPLFSSEDKFDSGTGWPSFTKPINEKAVKWVKDNSYGMVRDEVVEASTGLHLGHVFNDGPAPTGLRYCINSAALKFIPATK